MPLASALGAVLLLALWNVFQALLSSKAYRSHPENALHLFAIGVAAYTPMVLLPLVAVSIFLKSASIFLKSAPRPAASTTTGSGTGEPDDRDRLVAAHAALAGGVAALLFAIGIIAPRGSQLLFSSRTSLFDAAIAALAAVAAGAFCHRLARAALRSKALASGMWAIVSLFCGVQFSLLVWLLARDYSGVGGGWLVNGLMAAGSLLAGMLTGLGAVEILRALLRNPAPSRSMIAAGIALVTLLLLGGWWLRAERPMAAHRGTAGGPNVILIVADALRADHLGSYGDARTKTPNLDGLAARGIRVDQVYASASRTTPATASLLTSQYPVVSGLVSAGYWLSEGKVSVGDVFQQAGYRTGGIVANPLLSQRFGWGGGFDTWIEETPSGALRQHRATPIYATLLGLGLWSPSEHFTRAETVVRDARAWMAREPGRPFFLYLHLMDVHDPYVPPPPFDSMYVADAAARWPMKFGTLPAISRGIVAVEPEDLARLMALYDGALSYMDDQIGVLLAAVKELGVAEKTVIAFTADHGEEFNEHGGLAHARTLYEEVVRIPLIVNGPGVAGGRVLSGPVRQIDVAPTLLEAAGLAFPLKVEGASLWDAVSRLTPLAPREVFMEESYLGYPSPWHNLRAYRRGSLKAIGRTFFVGGQGPRRWELYDLAEDSRERREIAALRPDEVGALRAKIEETARRSKAGTGDHDPMDEELRRRLRALGYIQ